MQPNNMAIQIVLPEISLARDNGKVMDYMAENKIPAFHIEKLGQISCASKASKHMHNNLSNRT